LTEAVAQVLSAGQIFVTKSFNSEDPMLIVKLLDGSSLNLALTWQRAGLISIAVFGLLFVFLMFPLEGSIWLKMIWLELGLVIGLTWSFIRLTSAVLVACQFGAGTFAFMEFFTGPFTDFFWIVSVWSLGLSKLVSSNRKRVS
jgi:hypothetical protein